MDSDFVDSDFVDPDVSEESVVLEVTAESVLVDDCEFDLELLWDVDDEPEEELPDLEL